ncbi:hypothetical protein GCM10027447_34800 [Glycomyces halotolerans]
MAGWLRDLNPFELEARSRVRKRLKGVGLDEPKFYFGQVELKATVDTFRELRSLAEEFGGDIEEDLDYDTRYRGVKVFTVIEVEGIKVHVSAYLGEEEAEAAGFC